ncbi:hypothetical protein [Streptomyces sp. SAJ15]|uniref:hypothetical protein n=1 Tax=Streptomyces sp. SAJ15 TaxID=2011095 RepID=UPI0016430384|nr:hypothetical protein [Streptomyces sp. SAJ15]
MVAAAIRNVEEAVAEFGSRHPKAVAALNDLRVVENAALATGTTDAEVVDARRRLFGD